jgi:hypothetical protein
VRGHRQHAPALARAGQDDDQVAPDARVRLLGGRGTEIVREPRIVPQAERPRRPDPLGRLSLQQQRFQRVRLEPVDLVEARVSQAASPP